MIAILIAVSGASRFMPRAGHSRFDNNILSLATLDCGTAPIQLDPPAVPVPFSIDSPNFPTALNPGEIATFSVGFHPTKIGKVPSAALAITLAALGILTPRRRRATQRALLGGRGLSP